MKPTDSEEHITEFITIKDDAVRTPKLLTVLDRFAFIYLIRATWVFRSKPDISRLKSSLMKLLDYYPYLAGRVVKGERIDQNNQGIPFSVITDSNQSLRDANRYGLQTERYQDIRPKKGIKKGSEPVMTIKVTLIRDGWVLGVCCSHACLDGVGFYTMIKNWSRVYQGLGFEVPNDDSRLMPDPSNRLKTQVKGDAINQGMVNLNLFSMLSYLPKLSFGSFYERHEPVHFAQERLNKLKFDLRKKTLQAYITTNEAITAYLARSFCDLFNHNLRNQCSLVTVIDVRERLAGVPSTFAGNAAIGVTTTFRPQDSVDQIATSLHRHLSPYLSKPSRQLEKHAKITLELLYHRLPYSFFDIIQLLIRRPTIFYSNNLSKFPVYDVNFGTPEKPSRPIRCIPHNLGDPILIWPAPPEKGGVDVFFTGPLARAAKRISFGGTF